MSSSAKTSGPKPLASGFVLGSRLTILAVLIALASSSNTAKASCGDYLFRNGKPVSDHPMATPTERGFHSTLAEDPLPRQLPGRPCSGPKCSRSSEPVMPVPGGPSTLVRGFDQAAVLSTLLDQCSLRGATAIPESERGACFEPSPIFRPPAA